jgi:hypothetical protein
MGLKFLQLWIIEKNGISLIAAEKPGLESTINPALFSGFLSAIQSMAQECLDSIKMKDSKIMIIPVEKNIPFFVVGRASLKEKDPNIQKELIHIRDMFLHDYREKLQNWDGDVSCFDSFQKKISMLL